MQRGILVAVEGIDGSGKSTQVSILQKRLQQSAVPVAIVKAKEKAQDGAFNEFLTAFSITPDSPAYMFVYQALHRRQYEQAASALEAGKIVIADRWNISFLAYHALHGRLKNEPAEVLRLLDHLAFEGLQPDISFLLDTPVQVAFERRRKRGERRRFTEIDAVFYEHIAEKYRGQILHNNGIRLDGAGSILELADEIFLRVIMCLRQKNAIAA